MKHIIAVILLFFACGTADALVLYYDTTNTCNNFYLNIPINGCSGATNSIPIPDKDNGAFDGYYISGVQLTDNSGNIIKTPSALVNSGINLASNHASPKFTCNDGFEESGGECVENGSTPGGNQTTGNRYLVYKCSLGGESSSWIPIQPGVPYQLPAYTVCADYANGNYHFDGWSWKNGVVFQSSETHTFNESDFRLVNSNNPASAGFIDLTAKWTGADDINSAHTRADCEYIGGRWCTEANNVIYSVANSPHFSCTTQSNASDMCCYDNPQNCSYWQCKKMNLYWQTPDISPAVNFNYQYCQAEDFNRIEIKSGTQYFSKLYAWAPLLLSFTGHRDANNPTSNFIYVDTDIYYEDVFTTGGYFPTRRAKLSKIQTRFRDTDIHGGYYFDGYYTGENCTGTKCIDHDGSILPVACSGTVYECWQELDDTEPAEGVIKLYYGTCDAIPRCWEFSGVSEDDPRYHGTWYGPLYTRNGRTLYTDKDATQVAEYIPHVSGASWGYRLSYRLYTDFRFPDSPGNSFTSMCVGENKNRLLLFPGVPSDPPNSSKVSIHYDCGEGQMYGECSTIGNPSTLYQGGYFVPKRSAAPNDIAIEGCFCHRNGQLPCGWRNPVNNEILYTTGQAYGPWTYGNQTLTAVYDCNL